MKISVIFFFRHVTRDVERQNSKCGCNTVGSVDLSGDNANTQCEAE